MGLGGKAEENLANADFIVQACNAYDKDQQTIKDLVEACEATLEGLNNMTTTDFSLGKDKPLRNTLEQAIAKAKA